MIPYTSGWYQGFQSHHGDMSVWILYQAVGVVNPSAPLNNTVVQNVWNGTTWSDCGDILLPASGRSGWRNVSSSWFGK